MSPSVLCLTTCAAHQCTSSTMRLRILFQRGSTFFLLRPQCPGLWGEPLQLDDCVIFLVYHETGLFFRCFATWWRVLRDQGAQRGWRFGVGAAEVDTFFPLIFSGTAQPQCRRGPRAFVVHHTFSFRPGGEGMSSTSSFVARSPAGSPRGVRVPRGRTLPAGASRTRETWTKHEHRVSYWPRSDLYPPEPESSSQMGVWPMAASSKDFYTLDAVSA